MFRLTTVIFCFCLVGCHSDLEKKPTNFKERQMQLFYEINHELIYQSCQKLMLLNRKGKLSGNIFYYDDAITKHNELPESIRLLQPTYVHVFEIIVEIGFFNEDGMQSLSCYSNEFGQPESSYGNAKGWGWRKNQFGMDELSGKESLDYLNEKFDHFEIEFIPGLTYQTFGDEKPATLEEVKQNIEHMNKLFGEFQIISDELVIKMRRLLHQTNKHELLKACQQVIIYYNDEVFSTDKIDIGNKQFANDLKHIPKIILNLEPVYVWLDKNSVMVALIGGFDHAGVVAYMNNEKAVTRDNDIKLIDGLWYYDDGLRKADDDYKEYLKSLQKETIPYLDWKRKKMNSAKMPR